jgi:methylated-DNA-[protein]-cysteine S-methyltransferase
MEFPEKGLSMRYYDLYESPQGQILLAATGHGIAGVYFAGQKYFPKDESEWSRDEGNALLRQAKRELVEYFAGARRRFDVALDPSGTPFQQAVWEAISGVAYGETITYGELARRAGAAGRARAAGAATGRNPIGIIVPCHRIVGADGSLTGYAGGLERKRALLALEAGELPLYGGAAPIAAGSAPVARVPRPSC